MAGQGLLPGPAEAALFASAVLVLNATPGVDFLLTVSRTLQAGARAGAVAALGISAGCVAHALAAAFGLAALLALHPPAFAAIQWAGAAYLVWLGIGMLGRTAQAAPEASGHPLAPAPRNLAQEFRAGLLTNILNPKVAFFFLAFLPPFVPADSPSPTGSFLLLGGWFVLQGTAFLLLLVVLAARLRWSPPLPAVRRLLGGLGGGLFLALAWKMIDPRPLAP